MRVIYICIVEMGAVMYSSFCSWPIFSSLPVRPTRRLIVVVTIHYSPCPARNQKIKMLTTQRQCLFALPTHAHTHIHIRTSPNCLSRCLWLYVISSSFIQFAFQAICIRVYACVCVYECECDGLQHFFYHSLMLTFCRRICCLTQQHFLSI